MNTNLLKKFATEARTNLMDGVRLKLRMLGFDERGHAVKTPELISGGTIWNGEKYPEEFHAQWTALRDMLLKRGVREVVETAAYTWFNRMVAIRILAKNNLCEAILTNDEMTGMPRLLAEARMGRVPEMTDQQRRRFEWLMNDDNRTADQFSVLLTAWCHANPIINSCFGSIDDFVEILLPDNILMNNGFLSLLNHTEFITDEDFKSAELIGWLYQFYISDRKDEVFAKKGKVEAEDIPAATQIFTPNWIVKYMVQNTIIPQVDAPEEVVAECKYLVKTDDSHSRKVELEDLKVADFACGSGHILNECFDLLYDLYKAEAYSRREAIESVFTKNLLGIDIDLRAKQLTTFALMLKACQRDASFVDAHIMPKILTAPEMPEWVQNPQGYLKHFFLGKYDHEINEAWEAVKDAHTLGSIIKFNISPATRSKMEQKVNEWRTEEDISNGIRIGLPIMDFILALTDSYDAIVMNPPYMPTSRVDVLKEYAVKNYPDSKADLFSVFMDVCIDRLKDEGKYGMINMQSWMFLSSFEALRKKIIEEQHIDSLLHLGPRTFDELSGEIVQNVAFIISKTQPTSTGVYYRLIEGKDCFSKSYLFSHEINKYSNINQSVFKEYSGFPIIYWTTENIRALNQLPTLDSFANLRSGISTGDNTRFYRIWHECDAHKIAPNSNSQPFNSDYKWFKIIRGGAGRCWYGNCDNVINLGNDCNDIRKSGLNHRLRTASYYNKVGITWSRIASENLAFRLKTKEVNFGENSPCLFVNDEDSIYELLGLLNSKIIKFILTSINPTLSFQLADIVKAPIKLNKDDANTLSLVKSCVAISKEDWDAHETSWDFQSNELVALSNKEEGIRNIQLAIEAYERKWTDLFTRLHSNEEELNRRFIEIYGLQDELTPEVPLDEITILQQGEISVCEAYASKKETGISNGGTPNITSSLLPIIWNDDVIIKQLISYIVGVWMGRYRLDKPGLHIAHPNPTEEELAEYSFSITDNQTLQIDVDGIIPVLPADAPFFDNLRNYVVVFVRKVWGDDSLTENINFMEKCLGKSLDDFLMKDFWQYHKKMYQNRPIYWEFASKKGAFRALVYAHRMDRYTVEVLRSKYLLPYIGHIERKIAALELRQNELTTSERRELDNLRNKTLPELREYHDRVEKVAAETAARSTVFDLDDGIIHNHALFGDIVTKLK